MFISPVWGVFRFGLQFSHMPERVYRDLGGGNSLPDAAWEGATAEGVRRVLASRQPKGTDTDSMSFLQLAAGVQMEPIVGDARAILSGLGPELLVQLDHQYERQQSIPKFHSAI